MLCLSLSFCLSLPLPLVQHCSAILTSAPISSARYNTHTHTQRKSCDIPPSLIPPDRYLFPSKNTFPVTFGFSFPTFPLFCLRSVTAAEQGAARWQTAHSPFMRPEVLTKANVSQHTCLFLYARAYLGTLVNVCSSVFRWLKSQ